MRNKLWVLLALITLLTTGCGSLYESSKTGYTPATSVNGVTFDMPSSFLEQATAITNIAEDEDYSNGTYLYKNGQDTYLLFNMDSVIIAVEQGTSYGLRDVDKIKERITETDVCEAWIDGNKKISFSDDTKKDVYKLIADVYADISITSTMYATCCGKFATIQYEDYECSMFVGIPVEDGQELTKEQEKTIEHIAKSFALNKATIQQHTENTEIEQESKESIEVPESTESIEVIDEIDSTEESEMLETETTEEIEIIETEEPDSEPADEENTEVEAEDTEINTELSEENQENESEMTESIGSNQSEAVNGYSDIYHLLNIGDFGYLNALTNDGTRVEQTMITLDKLYTGEEAISIIKEFCNKKDSLYKYSDAPAGYSWHVLEYSLEKKPEDLYVNIKLLGFDGEKLKFRGVAASSRTYDIFSFIKAEKNGYGKVYCYYAVPNGCKEYMIECGTRTAEDSLTACYKISNWR